MRIPLHYVKTFQGPAHGIVMEREYLNKYGAAAARGDRQAQARPVGAQLRPGGAERPSAAGSTSPRTTRTSTPSRSCAGVTGSFTASRGSTGPKPRPGEIKGHYMNVTAATMEDMYERAEFVKDLGSVIVMIDLTVGYTAIQSMAAWACRDGLILHLREPHRTSPTRTAGGAAAIQKWMRLAGVDHIHAGTVVGKLEGDPNAVAGFYDTLRLDHSAADPVKGSTSTRTGGRSPGYMPVGVGRDPRRPDAPADRLPRRGRRSAVRWRHDRPPMGIAAGATANRVRVSRP